MKITKSQLLKMIREILQEVVLRPKTEMVGNRIKRVRIEGPANRPVVIIVTDGGTFEIDTSYKQKPIKKIV